MSAYKPAKQFHSLARSLTGHVLSPAFDFSSDRFPIELCLFPADCHLFTQPLLLSLWSSRYSLVVLLLVRRGVSLFLPPHALNKLVIALGYTLHVSLISNASALFTASLYF